MRSATRRDTRTVESSTISETFDSTARGTTRVRSTLDAVPPPRTARRRPPMSVVPDAPDKQLPWPDDTGWGAVRLSAVSLCQLDCRPACRDRDVGRWPRSAASHCFAHLRLRRLRRDLAVLQAGDDAESFLSAAAKQVELVARLRAELSSVEGRMHDLRLDVADALRHVAVVRYDAFRDMGGRMSFSAALLDDAGDGLVISAIHGRTETRSYAKGVKGGTSDQQFSPEERQAIAFATRSAPVRAVASRPPSSRILRRCRSSPRAFTRFGSSTTTRSGVSRRGRSDRVVRRSR